MTRPAPSAAFVDRTVTDVDGARFDRQFSRVTG
jgi:hypothetical protein